jgi:hypothetical protein
MHWRSFLQMQCVGGHAPNLGSDQSCYWPDFCDRGTDSKYDGQGQDCHNDFRPVLRRFLGYHHKVTGPNLHGGVFVCRSCLPGAFNDPNLATERGSGHRHRRERLVVSVNVTYHAASPNLTSGPPTSGWPSLAQNGPIGSFIEADS